MEYHSTKEKITYFDLPGGMKLKAILRGELDRPLAIMMHGRPGSGNELLQYLGARYLSEKGISSLRLFMYDFEPKTRRLVDCTLQTHADDFDAVVSGLRKQTKSPLFGIGHSYGGITILKSRSKLDGAVLWDPSHGLSYREKRTWKSNDSERKLDELIIHIGGAGFLDTRAAEDYDQELGDTTAWAQKKYPLAIITAGSGILVDFGKRYFEAANNPKKHILIEKASHHFDDSDQITQKLFDKTSKYISSLI